MYTHKATVANIQTILTPVMITTKEYKCIPLHYVEKIAHEFCCWMTYSSVGTASRNSPTCAEQNVNHN